MSIAIDSRPLGLSEAVKRFRTMEDDHVTEFLEPRQPPVPVWSFDQIKQYILKSIVAPKKWWKRDLNARQDAERLINRSHMPAHKKKELRGLIAGAA